MATREVHKFIAEGPRTIEGNWEGSFNWHGTLLQVLARSWSPETTYNIGIVDEDGMVVFLERDLMGHFISKNLDTIIFPGEKRIVIEDASEDEFFDVKLIYQK